MGEAVASLIGESLFFDARGIDEVMVLVSIGARDGRDWTCLAATANLSCKVDLVPSATD